MNNCFAYNGVNVVIGTFDKIKKMSFYFIEYIGDRKDTEENSTKLLFSRYLHADTFI